MSKIPAAHAAGRPHGAAFRELDARVLFRFQQLPENLLFRVVRASWVAGSRTNAAVTFADQVLVAQIFRLPVSQIFPCLLVETLGERFRQTVGNRFGHDRAVVIMVALEFLADFLSPLPGRDREYAEVILQSRFLR